MSTSENASNRTLTIKKTFDAPVKVVWEAWTHPDHVIKWWGPKGMPIKVIEHEFKVGGKWKYIMPMPDGNEFISDGVYKEITPFKKIVTTANFKPMTNNVELHATFEEDGDKTNFTFSVVHETEEYCKQQEKMGFYNGWGSALNRMEEVINNLK